LFLFRIITGFITNAMTSHEQHENTLRADEAKQT
jgi:hypothetical protein